MTSVEGATTAEGRGDGELWSAAALGDRVAFTELYHRHADAVWRLAMRMTGSRAAAEDVLAATFLAAWRKRAEVRLVHASARPWLLTVAANEARTEWRKVRRHERLAHHVGPPPDVRDHADAVVASLDDRRRVHAVLAAVAALPAGQRDVVALCLIAEVSQADAAKALGITQVTLRSRLHRARAQLRAAAGPATTGALR
jgi:RNA polymerase sigma-70 factor (ECF subfamily)